MTIGLVDGPETSLLACPICHASIRDAGAEVVCTSCGHVWPRRDGYVDFLSDPAEALGSDWSARQDWTMDWYGRLVEETAEAGENFARTYEMIEWALKPLRGRVLDIGGGVGITREYLSDDVEYVNLDPSLDWLSPAWQSAVRRFRKMNQPMAYVRGVGEHLPFRDKSFDAAVSLWSLSHAARPDLMIREAHRVLKPGGTLVLVIQEMEPRWRDLIAPPLRRRPRMALRKIKYTLSPRPWPVQQDHTRISEAELVNWTAERLTWRDRRWATSAGSWPLWRGQEPPSVLVCQLDRRLEPHSRD